MWTKYTSACSQTALWMDATFTKAALSFNNVFNGNHETSEDIWCPGQWPVCVILYILQFGGK